MKSPKQPRSQSRPEGETHAKPDPRSPAAIKREFRALLSQGARLSPAGRAKRNPVSLLRDGLAPKFRIDLFSTRFYLTGLYQTPELRFFVAYVYQAGDRPQGAKIYPRIFYKDVSLIWRVASHMVNTPDEMWIGKGDTMTYMEDGEEMVASKESTADLPLEIQSALEELCRVSRSGRRGQAALEAVLRKAPPNRIAPYADFTKPRRAAAADPKRRINGGKRVAFFKRPNVPESLHFVAGFEPDFENGVVERSESVSNLYRGKLLRLRIMSRNRKIQYLFFRGPHHAWIAPPQDLSEELSTYGVRVVDVEADEDVFVPGFEYHYEDDSVDPPVLVSQIPPGFAGAPSGLDDDRSDASPWLERLPIIKEFRRRIRP